MRRYAFTQSGFSIKCGPSQSAEFGEMGDLSTLVDGAFALCFDVCFAGNGSNTFFGGAGTGTRDLYLQRNAGDTNDNSITFLSTDASGDVRTVSWAGIVPNYEWARMVFNSSGAGAGTLKLYVDGTEASISSQTNDAGFDADEAFSLSFGEIDSNNIDSFYVTSVYVYDRELTSDELSQITLGVYPSDYVKAFPLHRPNRGVDRSALTPVVNE